MHRSRPAIESNPSDVGITPSVADSFAPSHAIARQCRPNAARPASDTRQEDAYEPSISVHDATRHDAWTLPRHLRGKRRGTLNVHCSSGDVYALSLYLLDELCVTWRQRTLQVDMVAAEIPIWVVPHVFAHRGAVAGSLRGRAPIFVFSYGLLLPELDRLDEPAVVNRIGSRWGWEHLSRLAGYRRRIDNLDPEHPLARWLDRPEGIARSRPSEALLTDAVATTTIMRQAAVASGVQVPAAVVEGFAREDGAALASWLGSANSHNQGQQRPPRARKGRSVAADGHSPPPTSGAARSRGWRGTPGRGC